MAFGAPAPYSGHATISDAPAPDDSNTVDQRAYSQTSRLHPDFALAPTQGVAPSPDLAPAPELTLAQALVTATEPVVVPAAVDVAAVHTSG